jgi:Uma2 family endonuclease
MLARMSGPEFRAFQAKRPDHERWELIEGVAVMMASSTIAHNVIMGNLCAILNDRLERYASSLVAIQRPGLELGDGDCKPEPDLAVVDADFAVGQRFAERAYLVAEVLSAADELEVPDADRKWIDVKRDIYRSHAHCEAVLLIAQDRMEVALDLRTQSGWTTSIASGERAEIALPTFGSRWIVGDLYRFTPLRRSTSNGEA